MPPEPQTSSAGELQMLQVASELVDVRSSSQPDVLSLCQEPTACSNHLLPNFMSGGVRQTSCFQQKCHDVQSASCSINSAHDFFLLCFFGIATSAVTDLDAVQTLLCLHFSGRICHLDTSPSHIMVRSDKSNPWDMLRLIDFGFARIFNKGSSCACLLSANRDTL